jgi:hypothetical protein
MTDSRTYAEKAGRFSQLSKAARSKEEREAFQGIAAGYLSLAEQAADASPEDVEDAEFIARSA